MGNCSYKGFDTCLDPIRVMTPSGQVLEFNSAKPVSVVLQNFPGHGVFRRDQLLSPLDHRELLVGGRLYYLFPLAEDEKDQNMKENVSSGLEPVKISGVAEVEPVRMSTSAVALQLVTKNLSDGSGFEVLPAPRKGVWKVKLVINTKQLEDILSEEVNTEALIEQMRIAAASSMTVGPRRSKGYWGLNLKPIICNVMNKMVVDDSSSPKSVSPLLQQQTK
ncbi:dihydroxy-acid dehydratase [Tanacetum coccineum]